MNTPPQRARAAAHASAVRVAAGLAWLVSPAASDDGRFSYMDGLRGWSAVVVCVHHVLCDIRGVNHRTPNLLLDGPLAVWLFFFISGFCLSSPRPADAVTRSLLARWPRLALPCCFHVVLAWLLGPEYHPAELAANLACMGFFQFFPVDQASNMLHLLRRATLTDQLRPVSPHFLQLWTMPYEMRGSLLVLLLCYARPAVRPRHWAWALGAATLMFWHNPLMVFFFGGFCARAVWAPREGRGLCVAAAGVGAMVALGYLPDAVTRSATGATILAYWAASIARVAAAAGVLHTSAAARDALTCRVSAFLGRISFSLYLCHWYIKDRFWLAGMPRTAAACVAIVGVSGALAAATTCVDCAAVECSRCMADWLIAKEEDAEEE